MSWSKILAVTAVVVFSFGIATIDSAVAGEKQKIKATVHSLQLSHTRLKLEAMKDM